MLYKRNEFRTSWIKEVDATLQVRHKCKRIVRNVMAGYIVLLPGETNRSKWFMARVKSIQKDSYGFVLRVDIIVGGNASKAFGAQIFK